MNKKILIFIIVLLLSIFIPSCSDMGINLDVVEKDIGDKGSVFILFDSTNSFIGIDENGDVFYYIIEDFNFTEHKIKVKQKLFNVKNVK